MPISILLYMLISEKNLSIDFAKKELEGTKLLKPINELQYNIEMIYAASVVSSPLNEPIQIRQSQIDTLFQKTHYNSNRIIHKRELDSLKKCWQNIKTNEPESYLNFLKHADYITFIIGNRSNLILDPDIDSYYLMDVILHRAPKTQRLLFKYLSTQIENRNIPAFIESLQQNIDETENSLNVSITNKNHPRIKDELEGSFETAKKSILEFEKAINSSNDETNNHVKIAAVDALKKNHFFRMKALGQLEYLLDLRITELKDRMYIALGLVGFLLLLTGFLFYFVTRRISRSVRILEEAATKVMNGELNVNVDIKSNDEFSGLSENFNRMIEHIGTSIKENFERLTKTETALNDEIKKHTLVEEALHKSEFLFKKVWEISSQGMRLADSEGKIIAANDAYCQIVQLPFDKIKGKPFSNIYHPSLRKEILDVYLDDFNNHKIQPHFEREGILWNDKYVCLEFSNSLITLSDNSNLVLSTIEDITNRKKSEVDLKHSAEQLRNLAAHLQSIREEERRMIAREIHDELGQVLTVLKIQVTLLSNKLRDDQKDLKEKIESVIKVIDQSVDSVQRITAKLRPGILDDLGLLPAIEWQADEFTSLTGIKTICNLPKEEVKIETQKSTAIFRIMQEALTNVARHAKATQIEINVDINNNNLELHVNDNGKGISKKEIDDVNSLGLLGIKERVLLFDGKVHITGKPGKGTQIVVTVPIIKQSEQGKSYDKYINS